MCPALYSNHVYSVLTLFIRSTISQLSSHGIFPHKCWVSPKKNFKVKILDLNPWPLGYSQTCWPLGNEMDKTEKIIYTWYYYKISREKLEPEPGFEPRTSGFPARRSATYNVKFPKADKLWVWFQLITWYYISNLLHFRYNIIIINNIYFCVYWNY